MSTAQVDLVRREGQDLAQQIEALAVCDAESFELAGNYLRGVKAFLKKVAELTEPVINLARQTLDAAREQRKTLEGPALTAEATLKRKLSAYETEQRRQAEEARRRVDEERRRLEEEAALRAAIEAEANGSPDLPAPPPVPVFVPPAPAPMIPKVAGISSREVWDFEVTDPALVPREYLEVSEVKIRGVVRAMKNLTAIPGVRVFAKRVMAAQA